MATLMEAQRRVGTGELLGQVTAPEATPVQEAGRHRLHLAGHCSEDLLISIPSHSCRPGFPVFLPMALAQSSGLALSPSPTFTSICLSVLKDHPSVFSPY